ncbi:ATP-binding cassette domain-containing protein [bacterium]|nr:ATP-binding cassette domain-containing protein [bacterium]
MSENGLVLDNLSFAYGPVLPPVLSGLSACLPLAGVSLILGPNAAGKTTLARVLAGLDSPSSGGLDWPPVTATPVGDWERPQASLVFEEPEYQLQTFEVGEELSIGLLHCGARLEQRWARVAEVASRLGFDNCLDTPVAELEADEQLGLLAAALFAQAPRLIVLDFSPRRLEPSLRDRLFALARSGAGPALLFTSRAAEDILHLAPGEKAFLLREGKLTELESLEPSAANVMLLAAAGLALPWYAPLALELCVQGRLDQALFQDNGALRDALARAGI